MLLPMNTRNPVLQDKRYKLEIEDFQITHEKSLIANALVFYSSRNRIGNFTRAAVDFFSDQMKTPLSLFEAPLRMTPAKQKDSIVKMISNMLFKHKIQLRIPTTLPQPAEMLSVTQYNTHYKNLTKYNIDKLGDIYDPDTKRTISFQQFIVEDESRKTLNNLPVPAWYISFIRAITSRRTTVTPTSTHSITEEPKQNVSPLPQLLHITDVQITTDGSHKGSQMGSAAIFESPHLNDNIEVLSKPTNNNPSAHKAELNALYTALIHVHRHNKVCIKYDCQEAIDNITKFQGSSFTQRQKLKTKDYPLVQAIVILMNDLDHPVIFTKIPRANNIADAPSRKARLEPETPIIKILEKHQSSHDYQMIASGKSISSYPRHLITDTQQQKIQYSNDIKVNNLWGNKLQSRIHHKLTAKTITAGLDRKNHLDSNLFRIQTFRINIQQRNIQTMDIRKRFTNSIFEDALCMMCENAITEDQDHAWKCSHTIDQKQDILNRAKHIILNNECNKTTLISPGIINRAFTLLGLTPQSILKTPLTRGIITKSTARRSHNIAKQLKGYNKTWIILISAALTRSFWELIWRPRTATVEHKRRSLNFQITESERQQANLAKIQDKTRKDAERSAKKAQLQQATEEKHQTKIQKARDKKDEIERIKQEGRRTKAIAKLIKDRTKRKAQTAKRKEREEKLQSQQPQKRRKTTPQPLPNTAHLEDIFTQDLQINILVTSNPRARKRTPNDISNPKRKKMKAAATGPTL